MRAISALPLKARPPAERGPVPEQRWIAITEMRVDEHYQRPFSSKGVGNVYAIVEAFDWRLFAPVVVSPVEGGVYAIVDGQHRVTAALMCGIDAVPCLVIQADRQHQARAFEAINGQVTRVTAHARFKARLVAQEPAALRIKAVADRAGVVLITSNRARSEMRARESAAFHAIDVALGMHGEETTVAALRAIVASAGDVGGHLSSAIINAVVAVLADHGEWRADPRLHAALELLDLEELRETSYRRALTGRVTGPTLLEAAIVEHLARELDPPRRALAAPAEASAP